MQQRKHDHEHDIPVVLDPEDGYHEDEDERRLPAHDHELRDDVREQDLAGRHARHPRAVQQPLRALHDEGGRRQRHGQEEYDPGKKTTVEHQSVGSCRAFVQAALGAGV